MSSNDTKTSGNGLGFGSVLTLIFITLKLTHVIAWSWWWVLSPLWIGFALFLIILAVIGVVAFVKAGR